MPDMRELLRSLQSLPGPYQPFDPAQAPGQPEPLFAQWLQAAIDAGIREPHAMTLSTVDADGCPDARVLILKNVDDHGWHFAISRASPKGRQITASGDRKSNRMSTSMAHVWGVSGMHTGDCWVDFSKPVARDFSV